MTGAMPGRPVLGREMRVFVCVFVCYIGLELCGMEQPPPDCHIVYVSSKDQDNPHLNTLLTEMMQKQVDNILTRSRLSYIQR